MPTHLDSFQRAETKLGAGKRGQKTPVHIGWQQKATADPRVHEFWFEQCGFNILIPTGEPNRRVVVDLDRPEYIEPFMHRYGELVREIVRTPRGGAHFAFRWPGEKVPNAVKVRQDGYEYDLRGDGGYCLAPPSEVNGKSYRFQRSYWFKEPERLAPFPQELMPPKKIIAPPILFVSQNVNRRILMARAYIAKIFAVSGSGGHASTYRAVCKCRDRGLTRSEAAAEMELWNSRNADPPWSSAELEHKLASVYGN